MEYISIKAIAEKFAIPTRTVYDKVKKNQNIRTKIEWRTKLIHIADFAKIATKGFQTFPQIAISEPKNESINEVAILQKTVAILQSEKEAVKEKSLSLQKVNTNLENSLSKYGLLLSEEKNEKKELIDKYDKLQNRYHIDLQELTKKYYLILGISLILILWFSVNYLPQGVEFLKSVIASN